ncbi:WD40 repeat domain-containing protein [Sphaerisporangium melleum]|nr:hypothetical protein [Sphaerisporangium melleum]
MRAFPLVGVGAGMSAALVLGGRLPSAPVDPPPAALIGAPAVRVAEPLDRSAVTAVAFTGGGGLVVGTSTGRVEFRAAGVAATPQAVLQVAHSPVMALAASGDGATVAAATAGGVQLLDTARPALGRFVEFPADGVYGVTTALALDRHARLLAVGTDDVSVFEVSSGRRVALLSQPSPAKGGERHVYTSMAFSADGGALHTGDIFGDDAWRTGDWRLRSTMWCVCFHPARYSPAARWASVGTSDAHVLVRNPATGTTTRDLTIDVAPRSYTGDTAISDGGLLFAGSSDGRVLAWRPDRDLPAGQVKVTTGEIGLLRLSPDARWLVAGRAGDVVPGTGLDPYTLWLLPVRP